MRRFVPFFCLGLATAAAITGALLGGLLYRANELGLAQFDTLVRQEDVLWGPAFYQGGAYKSARYELTRPDLLVLGSSRVTQFRAAMVPSVRFYNASLAATSLAEAETFLRAALPRHRPKAVVLGIDPWWFSPQWARQSPDHAMAAGTAELEIPWRTVLANALSKGTDPHFLASLKGTPMATDPLAGRRTVGYMAGYQASGFRPDGSRQYGEQLILRQPYFDEAGFGWRNGFRYYREKVRTVSDRFAYVGPLSDQAEAGLRTVIRLCREQGVGLVLFLPSFSHAVWQEIQEVPAQRDYFARFEAATARIAAEEGVELFDLHDLAGLGMSDRQTIDDIHVDEPSTAAALLRMAEHSQVLKAVIPAADRAALQERLAHPEGWATENIMFP